MSGSILSGLWVPGLPHVLYPERSQSWAKMYHAYEALGRQIAELKPDVLVIYSTQWISVLGTSFQVQAHPAGVHVDENWYEFGDLPFDFKVDGQLGTKFAEEVVRAGIPTKTVNYDHFPIDTGTIVALKFLNPTREIPVSIVSSWVYADPLRSATIGKAMRETILGSGKRVVCVASSLLSARFFTHEINPDEDKISNSGDEAWNKKILNLLESGKLEAISDLAPKFNKEVPTDMQFNAFHWLSGMLIGDKLSGEVLAYGPLWGTGAAIAQLKAKKGENGKNRSH